MSEKDRLQNVADTVADDTEGRAEQQRQSDAITTHEEQNRFGVKAKEIVPALNLIDTALASAWRRSTRAKNPGKVDEAGIIRKHLVISEIITPLEISSMSDDDVATLVHQARIAKSETEAAPLFEEPSEAAEVAGLPEYQEKLAALEAARIKWAAISTKRQSRAIDRPVKGREKARDEYNLLVQKVGRVQLHNEMELAETASQKNAVVIAYLAEEQNKLRDLVRHETDGKFINKFSNWMNTGSRKARIAKGVLIGVAVGTGGSFLLGAAGAASAAGLAIGASRFIRGFTMRNNAGIEQLSDRQITSAQYRADMQTDNPDQFAYMAEVFRDYFEADSRREQAKRRRAFVWGAGSIAVGAAAGHMLHVGVNHITGEAGQASHYGHLGAKHQVAPSHTPSPTLEKGSAPTPPPAPKPELPGLRNHQSVTYTVHPNGGWYKAFEDMGIPRDEWAGVLRNAGPKLHEQGWAYFDKVHHEWRISHPGGLSNTAVQTLKDASVRLGRFIKK